MTYTVSYETEQFPTDLPEGAKVERKATTFPIILDTGHNREFMIKKAITNGAYVTVKSKGWGGDVVMSHLPQPIARELAYSLLEAIGDGVPTKDAKKVFTDGDEEPPATVKTVLDRDGDKWYRQTGGGWSMSESSFYAEDWSDVLDNCPLVDVTP